MTDTLRDNLQAQIDAGSVIAVLGSGVSLSATSGNPLAPWTGLLHHGVQRCLALSLEGATVQWATRRADDVQHTQTIREVIQAADAVVGDTTSSNPNVFYETGYSYALESPTIRIARKGSSVLFDISSVNHIMYETIVELRERLKKRLSSVLIDGEA